MAKEARTKILIFRIRQSDYDELTKLREDAKITGVNTNSIFGRKLVLDFLRGNLVYKDEGLRNAIPNG